MEGSTAPEANRAPTTVVVVDDHVVVADLLAQVIQAQEHLEVLGTAYSYAQAQAMLAALRPDAVVLDARLGEEDGLELAARISTDYPELRILVLTGYADARMIVDATEAGVDWLLSKGGSLDRVLRGLAATERHGLVVDPEILVRVAGTPQHPGVERLAPREQQVLQLLAEGLDTKAIARELGISVNTCRGYIKSLLTRLGVHSQLQAVALANRYGLAAAPRSDVRGEDRGAGRTSGVRAPERVRTGHER